MSTQTEKPIRLGGVIYSPQSPNPDLLSQFASNMKQRGWRVGGILQKVERDHHNHKKSLSGFDLLSETTFDLSHEKFKPDEPSCILDDARLSDASKYIEAAIQAEVDLIIIEKFGEREQQGSGLADVILKAALQGIPTLVSLPAHAIDRWNEVTGNLSTLIPHSLESLQSWWPDWKLYEELIRAVPPSPIKQIIIGEETVLIETDTGCGVIDHPQEKGSVFTFDGQNLLELASLFFNPKNDLEKAIAQCALLAHFNRYDLKASTDSGLDHFKATDNPTLIIGHFQKNRNYGPSPVHIAIEGARRHLRENRYDQMIIASKTMRDDRFIDYLRLAPLSEKVVVGPHTPLAPCLYHYGIQVLSGRIVEDSQKASELVKKGAKLKDLKSCCRYATLYQG
jgi:hypothetical protein